MLSILIPTWSLSSGMDIRIYTVVSFWSVAPDSIPESSSCADPISVWSRLDWWPWWPFCNAYDVISKFYVCAKTHTTIFLSQIIYPTMKKLKKSNRNLSTSCDKIVALHLCNCSYPKIFANLKLLSVYVEICNRQKKNQIILLQS